jgi:3',5'-cyclic AMP phosphodiesterase CpdA
MFVLAHLSDPHLGPLPRFNPFALLSKRGLGYINWLRKRRLIHRPEVLARIVADVAEHAPDHIAVTGDLVNLSLRSEFPRARAWLQKLGQPRDVTIVPGNHDAYVRAAVGLGRQHWVEYMRGDLDEDFVFVRRRGALALIGLSTSLPTAPFAATGTLHGNQLARLSKILSDLGHQGAFRVVLIHHPPIEGAHYFRRLTNAGGLRETLERHGAELVLHGHHHEASLHFLPGPQSRIPVIGVPSASGAPDRDDDPAGYNLYEIEGAWGAWRCTMVQRGWQNGAITELKRQPICN